MEKHIVTKPTASRAAARDGSGDMFDGIAERYDLLNKLISFGLDRKWRRCLIDALAACHQGCVLDLATGTADVAIALAKAYPEVQIVGLDPSTRMLDVGQKKLLEMGLETRVELREGDAQALPFVDSSFDAVCIAFGIRNIPDRLLALKEMARTVRTGGRVAILELTEPTGSWLAPLARFHVRSVVPRLGGWLSGSHEYHYLQRSIAAFPPPDQFIEMMAQVGLVELRQKRLSFGAAYLFIGEVATRVREIRPNVVMSDGGIL